MKTPSDTPPTPDLTDDEQALADRAAANRLADEVFRKVLGEPRPETRH